MDGLRCCVLRDLPRRPDSRGRREPTPSCGGHKTCKQQRGPVWSWRVRTPPFRWPGWRSMDPPARIMASGPKGSTEGHGGAHVGRPRAARRRKTGGLLFSAPSRLAPLDTRGAGRRTQSTYFCRRGPRTRGNTFSPAQSGVPRSQPVQCPSINPTLGLAIDSSVFHRRAAC